MSSNPGQAEHQGADAQEVGDAEFNLAAELYRRDHGRGRPWLAALTWLKRAGARGHAEAQRWADFTRELMALEQFFLSMQELAGRIDKAAAELQEKKQQTLAALSSSVQRGHKLMAMILAHMRSRSRADAVPFSNESGLRERKTSTKKGSLGGLGLPK